MKYLILFLFWGLCFSSDAQSLRSLEELVPDSSDYANIYVKKIDSDSLVSNFIIWVKRDVKAHKHLKHSETIIVLDGTATMILGNKTIQIKKGDYIFVPKNTPHSVKVTSMEVLKVLSIQAPEFKGDDRIFIESEKSNY